MNKCNNSIYFLKFVYTICFYIYVSLNKRITKMAYAGILATIEFYTARKDDLTSEISDIMLDINMATKESGDVAQEESKKKQNLLDKAKSDSTYADSTEYEQDKQDLEDQYNARLEDINSWEKELEIQKQNLQTEVEATSAYLDSYTSMIKDNIKRDFTYGKGAGSS